MKTLNKILTALTSSPLLVVLVIGFFVWGVM